MSLCVVVLIGHDSSWRVCIFHYHKIHYFGLNLFSFLPIVSRSFAPSFSLSSFVAISLDWCLSLYRFDAFKCFLTSLRPFKGYQVIYSSRSLSLWKGNSFVNCINPPLPHNFETLYPGSSMPRTYSQELYGFVITDEFDPGNTLLMQQLYNLGLFCRNLCRKMNFC